MSSTQDVITAKVQELNDIELAAILCLTTNQHCIITTDPLLSDDVAEELKNVAEKTLGLTAALLNCTADTSLDDFGRGVLTSDGNKSHIPPQDVDKADIRWYKQAGVLEKGQRKIQSSTASTGHIGSLDSLEIGNIVIAKNLNQASEQVQIQALELLRGGRVYTRSSIHTAPRRFLLVALLDTNGPSLTSHLNDHFLLFHRHDEHDEHDELLHLSEKFNQPLKPDDASDTSVIRISPSFSNYEKGLEGKSLFSKEDIDLLIALTHNVRMSAEIQAYIHNISVFMRLHRAVAGGVSAKSSRYLADLSRAMAPLHGLNYVSPSLVALAARKVYPHRIALVDAENERSLQWGSSIAAVRKVLDGITVSDIIEEVLETVEVPL